MKFEASFKILRKETGIYSRALPTITVPPAKGSYNRVFGSFEMRQWRLYIIYLNTMWK